MADPLPHPSKDKRQKPDPSKPPSSPYEPYKSPFRKASKIKRDPVNEVNA